jgi:K+-transporting ATPase KdpF subunit
MEMSPVTTVILLLTVLLAAYLLYALLYPEKF